jgi:protein arginine kinase activator
MFCEICNKNEASVHLTEIVNNQITELHLCQDCAKKKAGDIQKQLSMADFLSGLAGAGEPSPAGTPKVACTFCGLTYEDFKKKGRLGCVQCYTAFKPQLLPLLKKIHGSTQHMGKVPQALGRQIAVENKVKELRDRLSRAIQLEEYEEAARIRDLIKKAKTNDS